MTEKEVEENSQRQMDAIAKNIAAFEQAVTGHTTIGAVIDKIQATLNLANLNLEQRQTILTCLIQLQGQSRQETP